MSDPFAITARWLFPISSPPIAGGVISIASGRIVAVGENLSGQPPRDLGNVAVLPGLVNAHTHLEFSDMAAPLGSPGMPFGQWILEVVRHRREPSADTAELRSSAVAKGLAESEAAGVVAVGEIATPGWPERPFAASGVDCTVFLELLGLRTQRSEPLWQAAVDHVADAASVGSNQTDAGSVGNGLWRAGLSPHAPYTVSWNLFRRICGLSADSRVPVAMHLAETMDELELLASHSGPLVEILGELDAWDPSAIPRGIRPLDYLHELSTASRALVIHGNYLDERELAYLGQHRDHMSLVYCPRTHAYFGHGTYPLARALELGVNVCLGTDSRASNPDLSLLEEVRHVARTFPDIPLTDILCMGMLNGARALGLEQDLGSLEPGKVAQFCLVPLSDRRTADPHELLIGDSA